MRLAVVFCLYRNLLRRSVHDRTLEMMQLPFHESDGAPANEVFPYHICHAPSLFG